MFLFSVVFDWISHKLSKEAIKDCLKRECLYTAIFYGVLWRLATPFAFWRANTIINHVMRS
ncbi:hypothetical protein ABT47_04025 [Shewanella xiamenensis]|nr:hypothetical protein ABT47_04025 [Shewanella xiamenensis]